MKQEDCIGNCGIRNEYFQVYTLELARQAVAAVLHPLSSQFFWRLHQQLELQQIPWSGDPLQQL